jgi:hypothetical protein
MGLDIYAGTLSRYYARDWQTVVQSIGGVIVYPDGEPEKVNIETATAVVLAWRDLMNTNIEDFRNLPLDWSEDSNVAYYTDKPDFEGWLALQLWAAYADEEPASRPTGRADQELLENDRVFQAAQFQEVPNPLVATLQCEFFVPSELTFVFKSEDPNGHETWIGTTAALRAVLKTIDMKTWNATFDDLEAWLQKGLPAEIVVEAQNKSWIGRLFGKSPSHSLIYRGTDRMQHAAKFAFAVYQRAIEFSDKHNVPIVLDY